eukprot:2513431-Heterocapsa_arctica.AAC.1
MDFRWKGAMTSHGISSTWPAKDEAKTQQKSQPQGPGAPGAPLEAAPLCFYVCFCIVSAGRELEIPRRVAAPPYSARGHILMATH